MSGRLPNFGPYPYGHSATDVFLNIEQGIVNFEYFREFFNRVSLPMDLAKKCMGDRYSQFQGPKPDAPCIKFVKLSTLRKCDRLPSYAQLQNDLVDHRDIETFKLAGPLSMWPRDDTIEKTPCIFLSHRWQSPEHPDPDGAHLRAILERSPVEASVYLWIDYCCLPQRQGGQPLSDVDRENLRAGLMFLPEIVKSCDFMILHSPDYMDRVWCYTELFVWLSKIAEQSSHNKLQGRPLFESVQTHNAKNVDLPRAASSLLPHDEFILTNLLYRGYGGTADELLDIFKPVFDYTHGAIDSASYTLGAYETEYVPHLIGFMCNAWYALQRKSCALEEDMEICLSTIVRALKFVSGF
jgi:hypothetical protein